MVSNIYFKRGSERIYHGHSLSYSVLWTFFNPERPDESERHYFPNSINSVFIKCTQTQNNGRNYIQVACAGDSGVFLHVDTLDPSGYELVELV